MLVNNIIFIGGIHGVGKTTLCKKISAELPIEHFSSSELISMLDSQKIRNDKIAEDIKGNQNLLLDAVEHFLHDSKVYLLDGHFCLIDGDYSIKKIPIKTFESLGIKGIIILSDDEEKILERLKGRDNRNYSLEFIRDFQENEITYGKYVADKIKVPLRTINISKEKWDITFIAKELLY